MVRHYVTVGLGCGAVLLAVSASAAAQQTPPVTGTVALEGTVDQTYKAANTVIVKTVDGVRHLFHLTGKTDVHGNEAAAAFRGLEVGSTVVVHYLANGREETALEVDRVDAKGLKTMEGVVTGVDRKGRTITIRLADGSTETLRLTDRAAVDVGKDLDRVADNATVVVVYYANEAGQRVAHYFKRVS
jgi:arginine repressor